MEVEEDKRKATCCILWMYLNDALCSRSRKGETNAEQRNISRDAMAGSPRRTGTWYSIVIIIMSVFFV